MKASILGIQVFISVAYLIPFVAFFFLFRSLKKKHQHDEQQ